MFKKPKLYSPASSHEITRVLEQFQVKCFEDGFPLNEKCMKELIKRMSDVKPKLYLNNCSISDEHLVTLTNAMKEHLVLQKVELPNNNISTVGAEAILKLLKDQLYFVMNTKRMDRLSKSYVGTVTLSPSNEGFSIDQNVLDEIDSISSFLNFENARCLIRNAFAVQGGIDTSRHIQHNLFKNLYIAIFQGKVPTSEKIDTLIAESINGEWPLKGYDELEQVILYRMYQKNLIPIKFDEYDELYQFYAVKPNKNRSASSSSLSKFNKKQTPELKDGGSIFASIDATASGNESSDGFNNMFSSANSTQPLNASTSSGAAKAFGAFGAFGASEATGASLSMFDFDENSKDLSNVQGLNESQTSNRSGKTKSPKSPMSAYSKKLAIRSPDWRRPVSPVVYNEPNSPIRKFAVCNMASMGLTDFQFESPFTLDNLHFVRKLTLSDNSLTHFDFSILSDLPNIRDVDLSHNKISSISGVFPSTVKRLNISYNALSSVRSMVTFLNIVELFLGNNQISSLEGLPPNNLEKLDISNNILSAPFTFRILSICDKLAVVKIDGNPIVDGPKCDKNWKFKLMSYLPRLVEINGNSKLKPRKNPYVPLADDFALQDTYVAKISKIAQRQADRRKSIAQWGKHSKWEEMLHQKNEEERMKLERHIEEEKAKKKKFYKVKKTNWSEAEILQVTKRLSQGRGQGLEGMITDEENGGNWLRRSRKDASWTKECLRRMQCFIPAMSSLINCIDNETTLTEEAASAFEQRLKRIDFIGDDLFLSQASSSEEKEMKEDLAILDQFVRDALYTLKSERSNLDLVAVSLSSILKDDYGRDIRSLVFKQDDEESKVNTDMLPTQEVVAQIEKLKRRVSTSYDLNFIYNEDMQGQDSNDDEDAEGENTQVVEEDTLEHVRHFFDASESELDDAPPVPDTYMGSGSNSPVDGQISANGYRIESPTVFIAGNVSLSPATSPTKDKDDVEIKSVEDLTGSSPHIEDMTTTTAPTNGDDTLVTNNNNEHDPSPKLSNLNPTQRKSPTPVTQCNTHARQGSPGPSNSAPNPVRRSPSPLQRNPSPMQRSSSPVNIVIPSNSSSVESTITASSAAPANTSTSTPTKDTVMDAKERLRQRIASNKKKEADKNSE